MSNETVALSLRIPADAYRALTAFTEKEGVTVTDGLLQALYSFLADKVTTDPAAAARMAAEVELSNEVLSYAKQVIASDYDENVTQQMFDWIESKHCELYRRAVGPDAAQAYRINPQIAKRFAYAIGATPILDAKGKPSKAYLERNANKLIQSYTLLRKGTGQAPVHPA